MLAALIGSLLIIAAVGVYAWSNRRTVHSDKMRREALRRYAIDASADDASPPAARAARR